MAYSLINFSAVGFDAVRIPHGEEYARVLLTALTANNRQIHDLAARHPGHMRQKRWAGLLKTSAHQAATLRRSVAKLAEKPQTPASATPPHLGAAMSTVQSLQEAPIGSLQSLDRLIREDLLHRDGQVNDVPEQPTHNDAVWACAEFDACADDMASIRDAADPNHPTCPAVDAGTLARAAEVLADAAAAAFLGPAISPDQRTALCRPYNTAVAAWAQQRPDVPAGNADKAGDITGTAHNDQTTTSEPNQSSTGHDWAASRDIATALADMPEHVRIALCRLAEHSVARHRGRWTTDPTVHTAGTWAPAMNQACWAVHFSRRHRVSAAVQLLGALAFRHAQFTSTDAAHGAWNAVSGTLQAVLVDDLLGAEHRAVLVAVWGGILGPPPHSADFPTR